MFPSTQKVQEKGQPRVVWMIGMSLPSKNSSSLPLRYGDGISESSATRSAIGPAWNDPSAAIARTLARSIRLMRSTAGPCSIRLSTSPQNASSASFSMKKSTAGRERRKASWCGAPRGKFGPPITTIVPGNRFLIASANP